jgi:hypothetical protein
VELGDGAAGRWYGRGGGLGTGRAPASRHGQRRRWWGLRGELAGTQVQQAPHQGQLRHASPPLACSSREREGRFELKREGPRFGAA